MIKSTANQHRHKQVSKTDEYNFHHVKFVEQNKISVPNVIQANDIRGGGQANQPLSYGETHG